MWGKYSKKVSTASTYRQSIVYKCTKKTMSGTLHWPKCYKKTIDQCGDAMPIA